MTLAVAMLAFSITTNILLGVFVLSLNPKSPAGRAFCAISGFVALWAVVNYLTDHAPELSVSVLSNRLAYLMGFLSIYMGMIFTYYFPSPRISKPTTRIIILIVGVAGSVFSLTKYVAGTVLVSSSGSYLFHPGTFSFIYVILLFVVLGYIIRNLRDSMRSKNKQERLQARLVLWGFVVTIIVGLVTNLILPSILADWESAKFGPSMSIILVGTITYAMVKHGLFDFRTVFARSLGYVSTLAVFASVYGSLVFGFTRYVLRIDLPIWGQMVISLVTALASLLFPYLKNFFDRITNRIFFQDVYEAPQLLADINRKLVSVTDLKKMLTDTNELISSYIRPEFSLIVLSDGDDAYRLFGDVPTDGIKDMKAILRGADAVPENVIIRTSLSYDSSLFKYMTHSGVSILAKVATDNDHASVKVYILLGPKKSGSAYAAKDAQALSAVADVLIMATQSAMQFEEIQKFNVTLEEKIEQATRKLQKANEKLVRMDETKDEFISMASHQLRTPLTSVKGYVSMVLEGDAGPLTDMQRKLLDQAFISSQRMVYLIADLLNVSRLRTGKFVIEPSSVNLADVIEGEVTQLQGSAKDRNLTLTYTKPKDFPLLVLDETKTRQVIMNFMDNAVYYTPQGGHIHVALTETEKMIEFTVTDDGIGIPRHDQPHMFTKFYRANNARKARPDGTGLGLYMAKKVVVAQGGAVIFRSKEGKGSTFGFTFAKAKLRPSAGVPETQDAGVSAATPVA